MAQNKKTFHWAEFPEQTPTPPLLEVLTEKSTFFFVFSIFSIFFLHSLMILFSFECLVEISACKDIFVGQMCPLFSGKKGRMEDANFAFSIMPHEGENSLVDFVADNQTQYSEWTDGFFFLFLFLFLFFLSFSFFKINSNFFPFFSVSVFSLVKH